MTDRFSRTAMLLGPDAMKILEKSHVAVFGVGGVGSYAAAALARSGVGEFTLVDKDTVSLSNINRQLVAAQSTLGAPKADVMKAMIQDINPAARVSALKIFFLPENADDIDLSRFSYVVDAIDTVTSKLELITRCKAAGVPIISSMGAGNKLRPAMFEAADIYETSVCPLARVMRKELKARGVQTLKVVYSKEPPLKPYDIDEGEEPNRGRKPPGSAAFVPSVAGLIIASEVVMDLTTNSR